MALSIQKTALQAALTLVSVIAPKRATQPILTGVHMAVNNSMLVLTTTNLDQSITVKVPCSYSSHFSVVGDLRHLMASLKTQPDGLITLEHDHGPNVMRVRAGLGYFASPCLGETPDYPEMFHEELTPVGKLNDKHLEALLIKVSPFTQEYGGGTSVLETICIASSDKAFDIVGTDGSRLAWCHGEPSAFDYTFTALLPRVAADMLAKLKLKSVDVDIDNAAAVDDKPARTMQFNGAVKGMSVTFRTRCVDAQYPRYNELFPVDLSGYRTFNREELLSACKAAAATDKRINLIVIRGTDAGSIDGTVMAGFSIANASDNNVFALNAVYLAQWLQTHKCERVTLQTHHLTPGRKPILLVEQDNNVKHLLMPVEIPQTGWWTAKVK